MAERQYNALEIAEGRPMRDDLTALCEKHQIGKTWGFTPEQVALYLESSLHALYQVSPKRIAHKIEVR